jgi:hypothetical protein
MNALKDKTLWLGVAAACLVVFLWEALTGQLQSNRAVFNPASYK